MGYSSVTELTMSKTCGFTSHDIMSPSSNISPGEFVYAQKMGAIINLDDITHIEYPEQILGYIPETISCRYNPGEVFKVSNDIMDNSGDSRHGMIRDQMFQTFKALEAKRAKHFDIHALLVSSTVTNEYYLVLIKVLFKLTVGLKEKAGIHVSFINLSEGIGIPHRPDQEPNDTLAIGDGVWKVYEEVVIQASMDDMAVCTELGRFMMGPYGAPITRVIHRKHTHKEYVGMDACAVNPIRPAMYGTYHHITAVGREEVPCDHIYDMVGSLCESNDRSVTNRSLPEIERGNLLFIHDVGAHGFAMGYSYNGKLKSAELLLKEDGPVRMVRHAETPEGYFATFDFCDILKCVD